MPTFRSVVPGYYVGGLLLAMAALSAAMAALSAAVDNPAVAYTVALFPVLQIVVHLAGVVYSFMMMYRIHQVLAASTNGKYPISGARAVVFSFIPFFNLYWLFKWPGEISCFLNHLSGTERFGKNSWGWLLFLSGFLSSVLPGAGLLLGFFVLNEISKAALSVLPTAQLPVEDYTARYKSTAAVIIAFVIPAILIFVLILGLLAAIAVPNFMQARNAATGNQPAAQTASQSAPAIP